MTVEKAKQEGYTHHGILYGVPIYMTDCEDTHVIGKNWWYDKQLSFFSWLDVTFGVNECFAIMKGEKL